MAYNLHLALSIAPCSSYEDGTSSLLCILGTYRQAANSRHGLALVCTSRTLHEKLILRLYKEAGRKLSWYPLLFGVTEGKIPVLERCLEAGASLDYRWPYVGHFKSLCYYEDFRYYQPLDWAKWSGQKEAWKWLVSKKATSARDQFSEERGSDTVYIPMS
ncbi:hypothetical protein LCI18_009907 [Fusarium solani-melongenae]|uniref:Uncharacterized protein n=1 Tax=Fusarium solani subsp. cucurbitae TaxID=2747967 RepID=A0ACD3ZCP0_FUSSC|nr:hypothetical protein LCI18_009907 [Fusarium solani-melongenae]